MDKIKVLIIDDSELIRVLLTEQLSTDNQIEVVGAAEDAYQAREMIKRLNPDVITLDIEMPHMDGITFLRNLMRLRPMPVVMISTLTAKGADVTLQALELGAVDYIEKPKLDLQSNLSEMTHTLCLKVKQAARANVNALELPPCRAVHLSQPIPEPGCNLIAIGASTGGTEAIKFVLSQLPEQMPPIVVVQHMPAGFTASYAKRLNREVALEVLELNTVRAPLQEGHVYIAHGAAHLRVKRSQGQLYGVLGDGDPVNRHKPSVDVLFESVAKNAGKAVVGVLLTGMGRDGAQGMKNMYHQGAVTIAQNEQSSIVWGMPRSAIEIGAASTVLPLNKIADYLVEHCFGKQAMPSDKYSC